MRSNTGQKGGMKLPSHFISKLPGMIGVRNERDISDTEKGKGRAILTDERTPSIPEI